VSYSKKGELLSNAVLRLTELRTFAEVQAHGEQNGKRAESKLERRMIVSGEKGGGAK